MADVQVQQTTVSAPVGYSGRLRSILSGIEIGLGLLLIIMDVVGFFQTFYRIDRINFLGGGIWSGILFLAAGAVGVYTNAALNPAKLRKVGHSGAAASAVLNVVSSLVAVALLVGSAYVAVSFMRPRSLTLLYPNDHETRYRSDDDTSRAEAQVTAALQQRLSCVSLYFAEFVVASVLATLGCVEVCCRRSPKNVAHSE